MKERKNFEGFIEYHEKWGSIWESKTLLTMSKGKIVSKMFEGAKMESDLSYSLTKVKIEVESYVGMG